MWNPKTADPVAAELSDHQVLHPLLAPGCDEDVFHSLNGCIAFVESVVMRVGKVSQTNTQTLLKAQCMVPANSDGRKPSPKKLKPWLGKALNKFHYNLKEVIVRARTEAASYDGSKEATGSFLKGRRDLLESTGRHGVLTAYLAAVSDCRRGVHQCAFPEGVECSALVAVMPAMLVFVLSMVRVSCGVGYLVLCGWLAVMGLCALHA